MRQNLQVLMLFIAIRPQHTSVIPLRYSFSGIPTSQHLMRL